MSGESLHLLAGKRSPPRFGAIFDDAFPDAVIDSLTSLTVLK